MDFDEYEMRGQEEEQEEEQETIREEQEVQVEEETNFDDIDDVTVNPVDMDLGGQSNRDNLNDDTVDTEIPNIKKDVAGIKRSITNDVKRVFKNNFNVSIEKKNGPNSESILENTRFKNARDGRYTIEFKGRRIGWIERDQTVSLFENKNKNFVNGFKDTMNLVRAEYEKTPESLIKNLPDFAVNDILDSSVEKISEEIDQITTTLTEQELREFAGVLNPKGPTPEDRIKALETQADYWESVRKETEKDAEKGNPNEKARARSEIQKLENLEKTARLQADFERLKNNEKPIHEETLRIIDDEIQENDLSKLERFKNWAGENLIGFSAIAISIAGIIITVVIAGRKAVKNTAKVLVQLQSTI